MEEHFARDQEARAEQLKQELRDILMKYSRDPGAEDDGTKTPYAIMEAAINRFGADHQTLVAIEEMSELMKALIKYRRHPTQTGLLAIREEMADVSIVLDQMEIIYGGYAEERCEKLKRLERMVRG